MRGRLRAADERARVDWQSTHLELQVEKGADREAGAADVADELALLNRLTEGDADVLHVRVDLNQAVAVGDRHPDAEVVGVADGCNLAARRRQDRGAVLGHDVNTAVEVEVTLGRRLEGK